MLQGPDALDAVLAQFLPSLLGGLMVAALLFLLVRRFEAPLKDRLSPYYRFLDSHADKLLFVFLGLYVLIFGTLAVLRQDSFHSYAYDLGIFDQVVWNSARGHLFEETVMVEYAANLLGNHFSPILLAFVPLYWLWSDVRVLLIAQTLALAIGVLPVYWLARDRIGNRPAALVLSLTYFLFPALHYVNLFDFHEIALAGPFLGFALYFLIRERYRLFAPFLFLALLSREEIAIVALGFGLWIIVVQRKRLIGGAVLVTGAVWGYATILVLIPHFQGTSDYYYVVRYAHLGNSAGEIAGTVLLNPGYVLGLLASPLRIQYVLHLLAPLGLLPVLGLDLLVLAVPSFSYLLLSNYKEMYDITNQYSAVLIPPLFLALVYGVRRLARRKTGLKNIYLWPALGYVLTSSVISYYLYSPGPLAQNFKPERYTIDDHTKRGVEIAQNVVPPEASISAQGDLVPHFSHRPEIYTFPYLHNADYVLLDRRTRPWPLSPSEYATALEDLRDQPGYQVILDDDGYLLFKKKAQPLPYTDAGLRLGSLLEVLGYDLKQPVASPGGSIELALYWKMPESYQTDYRLPRMLTAVELVNDSGTALAGEVKEPGGGTLETDHWTPGDVVRERYTISLPSSLAPGEYNISVGIRDDKRNATKSSISYAANLTKVEIR